MIRQAPKVLLHDHLDGGLRPATIARARRTGGPPTAGDRRGVARPMVPESADSGSLERYLETFDHTVGGDADRAGADPGGPRVRRGPRRRRRRLRRGALRPRAAREQRARPRRGGRGGAAGLRRGAAAAGGRIEVRQLLTAMRHRARSMEIARAGGRLAGPGRGRVRHRRGRGGLPAHPAPGRLRVPPARERPLHDPRRRGVRAAVDLAGDPVVRRRPARARGADHRRHHGRRRRVGATSARWRRTCGTSGSRWRCAPRPTSRPGRRPRSPSTRSGCSPGCGSGSPSTPTTG